MTTVWIKLYLGKDDPEPDMFGIKPIPENIDDLKKKIKEENSNDLKSIDARTLYVYPRGTTIPIEQGVQTLNAWDNVPSDTTEDNPLIALVKGNQYHIELSHGLLRNCVYSYDPGNGVDPRSFIPRPVAQKMLEDLPESFADIAVSVLGTVRDDGAAAAKKTRLLLHGSPGSGKTSILGHLFVSLQSRYGKVPIFYVSALEHSNKVEQITDELRLQPECVVVLDDAHEWYKEKAFFGLFKGTRRILVAAATYAVSVLIPSSPVDIEGKHSAVLLDEEKESLLTAMGVPLEHRERLLWWFGNSFGRLQLLVPKLYQNWMQQKHQEPDLSLEDFYFRASALRALEPHRFVPPLSDEMKELLMKVLRGQAGDTLKEHLTRYGILEIDGDWSCDFVRRWYFSHLFQKENADDWNAFHNHNLPSSAQLLVKGLASLEWTSVQQSRESSNSGFPIEDIWQAAFYAAIGRYIPQDLSFCKERVTLTEAHIDFVLRNGSRRGIEFLIKSSRVGEHHRRFEAGGSYVPLRLTEYLVVDILPWGCVRDLHEVNQDFLLQQALQQFERLSAARRLVHAVFFVSNDVQKGILYLHDGNTVYEATRSPPMW